MSDEQQPPHTPPGAAAPSGPAMPSLAAGAPHSVALWPILVAMAVLTLALAILTRPDTVEHSYRGGGRAIVSRVQSDMVSLATALEAYCVVYRAYPSHAAGPRGVNGWAPPDSPLARISTLPIGPAGGCILTTPVAFIIAIPTDRFAPAIGAAFGYWTDGRRWTLFSPGPDGDYDFDDPSVLFPPGVQYPDSTRLAQLTYDTTNGTMSRGDIFKSNW